MDATSSELPRWFTPLRMLCIFTSMSVIVYLDRGLIGSTPVNGRARSADHFGTGIQGEFGLSNFEDGCLPAAFMVGLLVSCPIFVHFAERVQPFKLVGIGLLVWFVSVLASGLSWNFWSLLAFRTSVGVGEASFVILAAPFINQYAPPHLKALWLGIFLMAIPVGYALGYIYGSLIGGAFGWRIAFVSEACLMLPFAIFSFLTRPIPLGTDALPGAAASPLPSDGGGVPPAEREGLLEAALEDGGGSPLVLNANDANGPLRSQGKSGSGWGRLRTSTDSLNGAARGDNGGETGTWEGGDPPVGAPLIDQVLWVLRQRIYTLTILGNTVHTALLGMFSYWGPKGATLMFRMHVGSADLVFGVVTVLTGIFGTFAGGWVLDKMGGSPHAASKVCLLGAGAGFVALQLAFVLGKSFNSFVLMFAVGEFALFMLQSPMTKLILMSSPVALQPLAFSIQTVSIHVLGDVPSPPLAGWIHDHIFQPDDSLYPNSWRYTCIVYVCVLGIAIAFFAAIYALTFPSPVDRYSPRLSPRLGSPGRRSRNLSASGVPRSPSPPSAPFLPEEDRPGPAPPPTIIVPSAQNPRGALGIPNRVKELFVPGSADGPQGPRPRAASAATHSGHVGGAISPMEGMFLVDSRGQLAAVDEVGSSLSTDTQTSTGLGSGGSGVAGIQR